jgi:hypothetical protein
MLYLYEYGPRIRLSIAGAHVARGNLLLFRGKLKPRGLLSAEDRELKR